MTEKTKGYVSPAAKGRARAASGTRGTPSKKKPAKGWSAERRARQAENIRQTRPWDKATGPKTAEGKAVSKNNGYKHGWRSEDIRVVYRLLSLQRRMLKEFTLRHCRVGFQPPRNDKEGIAVPRNDVKSGEKTP